VGRHFGEATVPEGECGPCPVYAFYPGIRITTEEKSRENLSQGSRKVPSCTTLRTIRCVDWSHHFSGGLDWPAELSQPACASGDLDQPSVSVYVELSMYQGAPVAMPRHLVWSTCSFLTWVRATDLQMGTRSPSLDGWAAYTAELRFWWTDHSSCLGEDPTLLVSRSLFFLPWSICGDQVAPR
jgi:hypothetical protein